MRLCPCPQPRRDTAAADRLRCSTCAGWTPYGRLLSVTRLRTVTAELRSLLAHLDTDPADFIWAVDLATGAAGGNGGGPGRSSGPSDPTGAAAVDPRRQTIRPWVVLAGRLLERAVVTVRQADEAIGQALYLADPTPPERPGGEWYPNTELRGELDGLHAARARRHARGEGIPS